MYYVNWSLDEIMWSYFLQKFTLCFQNWQTFHNIKHKLIIKNAIKATFSPKWGKFSWVGNVLGNFAYFSGNFMKNFLETLAGPGPSLDPTPEAPELGTLGSRWGNKRTYKNKNEKKTAQASTTIPAVRTGPTICSCGMVDRELHARQKVCIVGRS